MKMKNYFKKVDNKAEEEGYSSALEIYENEEKALNIITAGYYLRMNPNIIIILLKALDLSSGIFHRLRNTNKN